jgi:hypothetical protein
MRKCPYRALGEIDRDVVRTVIAQLNEREIREMAAESPVMFYKWLLETFTAKRKAELELEFQTALLEKLQDCAPYAESQDPTLVAV